MCTQPLATHLLWKWFEHLWIELKRCVWPYVFHFFLSPRFPPNIFIPSLPSLSPHPLPHTTRHPTYQKDGLPRLLPMVGLCTLFIRRRRRNGPTHAQVGHVTSCDGHVMCVMCMRHVFIHCMLVCLQSPQLLFSLLASLQANPRPCHPDRRLLCDRRPSPFSRRLAKCVGGGVPM